MLTLNRNANLKREESFQREPQTLSVAFVFMVRLMRLVPSQSLSG